MTAALAHALAFSRHGHPVLPLTWPVTLNGRVVCSCRRAAECPASAKHPFGKLAPRGLLSATTDPGIIKGWFGVQAPDANLGVVTDKLIVLDSDPRHGGDDTLAALERENPFPPTWRVLTGGGGQHVIFACPAGVNVGSSQARDAALLGAGIDVRARNGYICAPPSFHISGRHYTFEVDHHPSDVPLADAPPWLIAKLAKQPDRPRQPPVPREAWMKIATEPVTEYADAAAAKLAGHLFRRGIDAAVVVGLLQTWNVTRCQPSLPPDELYRIINRIAAAEARRLERDEHG